MVYAGRARSAIARERRRSGPSYRDVYAALDLGTNNCRLLIARPAPEGFRVVDAFSRIVRLGEGVAANGHLSEPAIARTLEALRVCAAKMRRRRVTLTRAVATDACRRAGNCQSFLERVERETGLTLEIIGTREEAELALAGCASLLDPVVPHALVFDIGGGSTEVNWLALGNGGNGAGPLVGAELRLSASLPLGVVTLAERHGTEAHTARGYGRMIEEVASALGGVLAEVPLAEEIAGGRVQMLGTSGTVTTLTGVHLDLPRYDRARVDGAFLNFRTVKAVTEQILALAPEDRAAHPCIGRARADLVVAGCAILAALCHAWPVGRLRVADRGLREGILLSMMRPQWEAHALPTLRQGLPA